MPRATSLIHSGNISSMKIGIFTDHFYPELGGIQDSLEELSRELGRRGHIVHLWAPRASVNDFHIIGREHSEIQLGKTVTIHRIPSMHVMSPTRQSRIAIPYILPARDAFEACEVIHTNSFFGVGLTVLSAARRDNKPLIGTNHWAFAEFGDYFPPPLGALFNKAALAYVNWYYGRCDYMTAPGISTVNEQTNSGFTTPHEAISNPIDTDTYRPATHDERERLREKFGFTGPIITCVGRLAIEKKNDVVVRAFGIVDRKSVV